MVTSVYVSRVSGPSPSPLTLTPAPSLRRGPHQVLGTTLTSMVPPGVVSAVTHHRLGNLVWAAAVPLCAGSACGAFGGGQLAVRLPEEPLQSIFIAGMGGRKLWTLRGL